MNNSKKTNTGCSKINKETLWTFYKGQSWIYSREPHWPGSGNKQEAHRTLICFNFHTRNISSITTPSPAAPLWIEDADWGGTVAAWRRVGFPYCCAYGPRPCFWLDDVMHVSLQEAKFDASRRGKSVVLQESTHPCTGCVGGYFSYHLATQVENTKPIPTPKKLKTKAKHVIPTQTPVTLRCNAGSYWGLFVIFSGALSGGRADISESAQKPPEWCHAQLMSPGSNSISLMNSSHSGGMLMVAVPRGIKGRNAANAPTLPFDLTSVYLHLTYSPPSHPTPVALARRAVKWARPPPTSQRTALVGSAFVLGEHAIGKALCVCAAVTIRWIVWESPTISDESLRVSTSDSSGRGDGLRQRWKATGSAFFLKNVSAKWHLGKKRKLMQFRKVLNNEAMCGPTRLKASYRSNDIEASSVKNSFLR